jgi:hypothetical protein
MYSACLASVKSNKMAPKYWILGPPGAISAAPRKSMLPGFWQGPGDFAAGE